MAGAHLHGGVERQKSGSKRKSGSKKAEKPRSYGIFRIEFPRWFPWFRATARKEERVAASFSFFYFLPRLATLSFPRLNSSHPFSTDWNPLFSFSESTILQLSLHVVPFFFLILCLISFWSIKETSSSRRFPKLFLVGTFVASRATNVRLLWTIKIGEAII